MQNTNVINEFKRYILIIATIALLGELYVYPLDGNFRLSSGVVAFGLVVLLLEVNEIALSLWVAGLTLILRGLIYNATQDYTLVDGITVNLPGSIYYVLYGHLAYFFGVRKNRENLPQPFIALFAIDFFSNLVEAIIRGNFDFYLFQLIILAGLVRSTLIYGLYLLIRNQENIVRQKEFETRYIQLNNLISSIQAEMFYLKKSSTDIETVMRKSFDLYEANKEDEKISKDALLIAREVHEIKKDYYRVLNGFQSFLTDFENTDSMSLKDIMFIINGNFERYIAQKDKNVNLQISIIDNIKVNKYYSIFTILNNLITNAIDAILESGYIKIDAIIDSSNLNFYVSNNGEPIDVELLPVIFNPGFTTKFDETTGNSSTGIGLAHVINIIDEFKGTIKVDSNTKETRFVISIPLQSLRG